MNRNSIDAQKTCNNCGERFSIVRIDKRFCNDACRIDYNNKIKLENRIALPDYVKRIPKIILGNYKIMRRLNPSGRTVVSKEKLEALGFNFHYITTYHTTKKGDTYHFCFDQGYLHIKDNQVLLVIQQDQVDKV